MNPPCLIVADTSVLVAAFFRSRSHTILQEWYKKNLHLCYSSAILREYRSILLKIPPIRGDAERFLHALIRQDNALRLPKPQPLPVEIEDPADRKFLECAVAGGADFVVSLDRHLLTLREYRGIRILAPKEFLTQC